MNDILDLVSILNKLDAKFSVKPPTKLELMAVHLLKHCRGDVL